MYALNLMRSATAPETMVEAAAAKVNEKKKEILRRTGVVLGS